VSAGGFAIAARAGVSLAALLALCAAAYGVCRGAPVLWDGLVEVVRLVQGLM
jgi:hypothetical protein